MANKTFNIAVSGWSGVGSSSLTLLLANLLQFKFFPATKVFHAIDEKLGGGKKGDKLRKEFIEEIEPLVGKTIDNYTDHKLLDTENLILESDLAAFRVGNHPKVFSIFVKTDLETRRQRIKDEGGDKQDSALGRKDNVLQNIYGNLWGIDIFDEELINRKYSLVIDNTELSFEDELNIILDALSQDQIYKHVTNWDKYRKKIKPLVKEYEKIGKDGMLDKLVEKGLIYDLEDIFKEITILYPEEIMEFPDKIQKIFLGQD